MGKKIGNPTLWEEKKKEVIRKSRDILKSLKDKELKKVIKERFGNGFFYIHVDNMDKFREEELKERKEPKKVTDLYTLIYLDLIIKCFFPRERVKEYKLCEHIEMIGE